MKIKTYIHKAKRYYMSNGKKIALSLEKCIGFTSLCA